MGTQGFTVNMTLLSTLAALVIIVHSMEEGPDEGVTRRDVSPRLSEPGAPDFDQSWRTVDMHNMQKAILEESWGTGTSREPLRRRRPGRKRKRRPMNEAIASGELRPRYSEAPLHEQDPGFPSIYDIPVPPPRRRRKRPDVHVPNHPFEELAEPQRPYRRRGYRKKVPSYDDEANPHKPYITRGKPHRIRPDEYDASNEKEQISRTNDKSHQDTDDKAIFNPFVESSESNISKPEEIEQIDYDELEIPKHEVVLKTKHSEDHNTVIEKETKPSKNDSVNIMMDVFDDQKEPMLDNESSPRGKISIKELIKQNGGMSLSEILQRKNLSLTDLLNGKENAISVLKSSDNYEQKNYEPQIKINPSTTEETAERIQIPLETSSETAIESETITVTEPRPSAATTKQQELEESTTTTPKSKTRRRLSPGVRRVIKHRMRPLSTSTTQRARSSTRMHELNEERVVRKETPTHDAENSVDHEPEEAVQTDKKSVSPATTETEEDLLTTTEIMTTSTLFNDETHTEYSAEPEETETEALTTTKPIPTMPKILTTNSDFRKHSLGNRFIKPGRRPIKPNNAHNDSKQASNNDKLVTASEFLTEVQSTTTTTTESSNEIPLQDIEMDDADIDDMTTTRKVTRVEKKVTFSTSSSRQKPTSAPVNVSKTSSPLPATEQSAKIEILEILNDDHGGARLSKILSQRNMTLRELVELRERGSSRVHLADIFHNTSKEPNPPEPFLSKSLIEPISKETYPLKALIEAKLHEPPQKTKQYPIPFTNIPLIIDYGRNINENGENLGIVSLFKGFVNSAEFDKTNIKKDSEGSAYFTSVMSIKPIDEDETEKDQRKGRAKLEELDITKIFGNNELKSSEISSSEQYSSSRTASSSADSSKLRSEEDIDGDGVLSFEDLQMSDLENTIAKSINDKLETTETEESEQDGIFGKIPPHIRSIFIVSGSILGLGVLVFLLTMIIVKWRRNRKNKAAEMNGRRLPSPVFESRKKSRINCSSRSISPMLGSSNVYTMSTVDSRGKESPEYMWDTLRKPFQ